METGPPALIAAVVRLLVPPVCREHVLGDLWERYRSPGQFVLDAVQTVPLVVFSQVRRVCDPLRLGMQVMPAFVLFGGLLPASETTHPGWLRAALPVTAVALTLLLRDTYRSIGRWQPRHIVVDGLAAVAAALLTQGLLLSAGAHWLVDRQSVIVGSAGTLLWIPLLRASAPRGAQTLRLSADGRLSIEALKQDVRQFEEQIRRRNLVEMLASLMVIGLGVALWRGPGPIAPLGSVLVIAGTLFVAYWIRTRGAVMPISMTGDMGASIDAYRVQLIRQRQLLITVPLWYLLPLAPGMIIVAVNFALLRGQWRPVVAGLGLFVVVASLTWALNRRAAARVQERINLLTTARRNCDESGWPL